MACKFRGRISALFLGVVLCKRPREVGSAWLREVCARSSLVLSAYSNFFLVMDILKAWDYPPANGDSNLCQVTERQEAARGLQWVYRGRFLLLFSSSEVFK